MLKLTLGDMAHVRLEMTQERHVLIPGQGGGAGRAVAVDVRLHRTDSSVCDGPYSAEGGDERGVFGDGVTLDGGWLEVKGWGNEEKGLVHLFDEPMHAEHLPAAI